jgi:hypothetical protein
MKNWLMAALITTKYMPKGYLLKVSQPAAENPIIN